MASEISFTLKLTNVSYQSTIEGAVTVTSEAQLNDLDVSNYTKLSVTNIVRNTEYSGAFGSVIVNGKTYSANSVIDITSLETIDLKCRYYRADVSPSSVGHTISVKVILSK